MNNSTYSRTELLNIIATMLNQMGGKRFFLGNCIGISPILEGEDPGQICGVELTSRMSANTVKAWYLVSDEYEVAQYDENGDLLTSCNGLDHEQLLAVVVETFQIGFV